MNKEKLVEISKELRKNIIETISKAGSGHPGGSLSIIDIISYLYFEKMNVDVLNPKAEDRDRFVLSKGHAAPALYVTLAEKGFFDKEELNHLREIGSILQGHPDAKKCPGVDICTGSLGQGFSNSCGIALGNKLNKSKAMTYVVLGDGEIQEGIVWEAMMSASKYKLDNLVAIVDKNNIQLDGRVSEIMPEENLANRITDFGWHVVECNGHDYDDINRAFNEIEQVKDKPKCIIANTIKGKGVSFMEDNVAWHGAAPNAEQTEKAIAEIIG
ncbi:transketolase [Clostridium saudiense]|uniref:transketolase n=1 Tax=Clostridium saudiense TaxID=1414720 RepID=UPI0018ABC209|nr:transketolase [Clostridium saudiense]